MRFLWLIATCISLLVPDVAQGERADGNSLLAECQAAVRTMDAGKLSSDDAMAGTHCFGYVAGFMNGWQFGLRVGGGKTILLCLSPDVTTGQAVRVITKYLKEHPKDLNKRDAGLALLALSDAFPCNQNGGDSG